MPLSFNSFAINSMEGAWFECEFAGKTSKPLDDCKILDNDGFIFSNNKATHISVIDSQEINCKKNKVGQCFKSDLDFVTARKGREDSVKFGNSKLILSWNKKLSKCNTGFLSPLQRTASFFYKQFYSIVLSKYGITNF